MGFLIEEIGSRIKVRWSNIKGSWQLYLALLLIIPLTFSWCKRSYYRDLAGKITEEGQKMMEEVIYSPPQPKLIYMFLPNMLFRYHVFSGAGNLVEAVLPFDWENFFDIHFYTIEVTKQPEAIKEEAYIYLGMVNEKFKENIPIDLEKDPPERIKKGMDSLFPPYYERRIFYYYNNPNNGIEEITNYVYPETEVVFKISVSQPVRNLYISGDFNSWNETPLALEEGLWKATLFLKPGLYRYYFVTDKGKKFVLSFGKLQTLSPKGLVSLLPVANYGLPVGLSNLDGTENYNKVIEYKEEIRINPNNSELHRKLADLYGKMGFDYAVFWERLEADTLLKREKNE